MKQYLNFIRQSIKSIRQSLPVEIQQRLSKKIIQQIIQHPIYENANHIALYFSANGEVNLDALWHHAHQHGKHCYFPVIQENQSLQFYAATPDSVFKQNKYQIQEPEIANLKPIALEQMDIIFMPLVAFDKQGNRLGMGAGFYDRTLEPVANMQHKPKLIGVAYSFQQFESLPIRDWDVQMDLVIAQ